MCFLSTLPAFQVPQAEVEAFHAGLPEELVGFDPTYEAVSENELHPHSSLSWLITSITRVYGSYIELFIMVYKRTNITGGVTTLQDGAPVRSRSVEIWISG